MLGEAEPLGGAGTTERVCGVDRTEGQHSGVQEGHAAATAPQETERARGTGLGARKTTCSHTQASMCPGMAHATSQMMPLPSPQLGGQSAA